MKGFFIYTILSLEWKMKIALWRNGYYGFLHSVASIVVYVVALCNIIFSLDGRSPPGN